MALYFSISQRIGKERKFPFLAIGGVMRVVDEQTTETLHLYVIPEDQLPKKPDYPSLLIASVAFLCLLAILGISVFSAAPVAQEVSFTISIQAFHRAPVAKTVITTVITTGKGNTPATNATV